MNTKSQRMLTAIKEAKNISDADIQKAVKIYNEKGGKLGNILIQLALIDEKELLALASDNFKIPLLNLAKYKVNQDMAKLIPDKMARKHQIVPISRIGNTLTVAMSDPLNIIALDDIAILTKLKVEAVISTEKDVLDALDKLYGKPEEEQSALNQFIEQTGEDVEFLKKENEDEANSVHSLSATDEAPAIKIVDLLLKEALKRRASDLHIEPYEKQVRVRFRIDGKLESVLTIPKKNQNSVLARLKIMSRIDITENRIPQDGRFKIKVNEKEVDFRVSILPVHFGSKVVMRVLDKSALSLGLENMGFLPKNLEAFNAAVKKPFGMILITGPTGSGKSTTLYSILSKLNTPERNLITIEDPIEYQIAGITQIQTRAEIGLDFMSGLRAVLRQSPDVVMVGEIRDAETVDIAIKASLTGQLVLSTLHTNDAAGAITRLLDMGTEPVLISSSVIIVAAQRLARRVCNQCKEQVEIPKDVFERFGVNIQKLVPDPKDRKFMSGKGCRNCNMTGYRGRMGVHEVLVVDDTIRDLVMKQVSSFDIKEYAMKNGMLTLREDAVVKCCMGITTVEEVIRVTTGDE